MTVLLGGMVGEEIYMNDTTTGVSNDLQKVTQIARSMVCTFGMSANLGKMAFGSDHSNRFLGRDLFEQKEYSEETSKNIDAEVLLLVNQAYERAKALLATNRNKLDLLAKTLIEREVLDVEEAKKILGLEEASSIETEQKPSDPLPISDVRSS